MFKQSLIVFFILRSDLHCVRLSLTTLFLYICAKPKSLWSTTGVSAFIWSIIKLWLLRMIPAGKEFWTYKFRLAACALKWNQLSPDFPINVFPFHLFWVVHVLYKSIQIKVPITYMLGYYLPMEINEYFCWWTYHPSVLFISIELTTVNASI